MVLSSLYVNIQYHTFLGLLSEIKLYYLILSVYSLVHLCSFIRSLWEAGTVTIAGPITATVEDAILVLVIGFTQSFFYKQIVNSGHEHIVKHNLSCNWRSCLITSSYAIVVLFRLKCHLICFNINRIHRMNTLIIETNSTSRYQNDLHEN